MTSTYAKKPVAAAETANGLQGDDHAGNRAQAPDVGTLDIIADWKDGLRT
jgi:hypothetical protein